jgi:hypothetical protein
VNKQTNTHREREINEQTGSKKERKSNIYYYFNVFVDDDEFEQDREVNLKILKCFDNVPFLIVGGNCCFGDIEHDDDAPSIDDVGDECCCC